MYYMIQNHLVIDQNTCQLATWSRGQGSTQQCTLPHDLVSTRGNYLPYRCNICRLCLSDSSLWSCCRLMDLPCGSFSSQSPKKPYWLLFVLGELFDHCLACAGGISGGLLVCYFGVHNCLLLQRRSVRVFLGVHVTLRASLSGTFLQTLPDLVTTYATEGALFISAQLSSDAVSALRKVRVLIIMTVEAT